MLRIWRMSGQELPAVSTEEISDVKDLKACLRILHGFPMCMQQLYHNGNNLDNSINIDTPMDVQLVLLAPSSPAHQTEAKEELAESCQQGRLKTVRQLLDAGADKNSADIRGFTALMLAAQHGHVEIARLLWTLVPTRTL